MTSLTLRKIPDPVLRTKALDIGRVTSIEQDILSEMTKIMYLNKGVGLAATQVGIEKRLAIIDIGDGLIKLINPVIVSYEGRVFEEEGCLSVPEVTVKIPRAEKVVLDFIDDSGTPFRITAGGLLARAIQHELDHLSGKLILDYLSPVKKLILNKKARLR
jgi:peptide deformylase